ncbi:GNAT family N-acetyltransferase [Burkholderia cepacia]|uniref:GNAT family N-acetyltransferase n=1 Tax=Burkholderia cepacia TaxID=292 RepID=UPI001CF53B36|nr:GNAT family N-acetyltransferase [Burkholderia cepacia]MCA8326165.1 GNAT family N-acetyltransferase [Burkholderia cepacia]
MKISIEPFTLELAAEIVPLGQESWDECSEIKKDTCAYHGQRGLQIDPDIDQYLYLADHQSLIAFTLRDDEGVLHGYALAILYRSLHLKTELCGNVDTFFVQPDHRRSMPRLMSKIEDTLRERGVSIIGWPVTMTGGLYEILKRRGYIADDVVMELKLKDLPGGETCA